MTLEFINQMLSINFANFAIIRSKLNHFELEPLNEPILPYQLHSVSSRPFNYSGTPFWDVALFQEAIGQSDWNLVAKRKEFLTALGSCAPNSAFCTKVNCVDCEKDRAEYFSSLDHREPIQQSAHNYKHRFQ